MREKPVLQTPTVPDTQIQHRCALSPFTRSSLLFTITHNATARLPELIPNPGFEQYVANPNVTGSGSTNPSPGKSWITLLIFPPGIWLNRHGIPLNFRGYRKTASGSEYAGIQNLSHSDRRVSGNSAQHPGKGTDVGTGFRPALSNPITCAADDIGMVSFLRYVSRTFSTAIRKSLHRAFTIKTGEIESLTRWTGRKWQILPKLIAGKQLPPNFITLSRQDWRPVGHRYRY